jgi:hypothetical protein
MRVFGAQRMAFGLRQTTFAAANEEPSMNCAYGFIRSITSGYRRIVALLITFPVLWACNARTLTAPDEHPVQVGTDVFQQTLNREIDILFITASSSSPIRTRRTTR